ncbi:UNVERIFIED_CONTAM: hypothetical protein Slati_4224500 [Sesamum latifolium]|uniref:Reverse transcriptase domain-containing protein n=1 Tax=Sesamum latifolium TaxID=2727402 RepID=A0AAW2TAL8_9LAMI
MRIKRRVRTAFPRDFQGSMAGDRGGSDVSRSRFLPFGRISNNILLAPELFSGYNRRDQPPRCALKVDLRKAYDMLEWDFVCAALRLFGFPERVIAWVEECITTTTFSILLNWEMRGFFKGARGLRHRGSSVPLSVCSCHGSFVDVQSVILFRDGLSSFADWSGLEANAQKSQLLISKAAKDMKLRLLAAFGFQEGTLPIRYLGLPLISARLTTGDCRPLLIKVDERLKGWGKLQLSFAARVQLLRYVVSSLNIYWTMAFVLRKGVIRIIEAKMRSFLWQGHRSRNGQGGLVGCLQANGSGGTRNSAVRCS